MESDQEQSNRINVKEIEVLLGILAKKVDDGFASMNKRFDEFKEEQRKPREIEPSRTDIQEEDKKDSPAQNINDDLSQPNLEVRTSKRKKKTHP